MIFSLFVCLFVCFHFADLQNAEKKDKKAKGKAAKAVIRYEKDTPVGEKKGDE